MFSSLTFHEKHLRRRPQEIVVQLLIWLRLIYLIRYARQSQSIRRQFTERDTSSTAFTTIIIVSWIRIRNFFQR